MPKYVIEREIPGAGSLSTADLHAIAQKSCSVLSAMGPQFSGWRALSHQTRSTAFTSRQTKSSCVSMRAAVGSLPTVCPR
jgi:hypothetical protein